MANSEHLSIFEKGVEYWNEWRSQNPHIMPILKEIRLVDQNLENINFTNTYLGSSVLTGSNLSNAILFQTEFYNADLRNTNLSNVDLRGAKLHDADLSGTNLTSADLLRVDFIHTKMEKTILNNAKCFLTAFSNIDLNEIEGLETVQHGGPSSLDVATLYQLRKPFPVTFLRGTGVPDDLIEYLSKYIDAENTTR